MRLCMFKRSFHVNIIVFEQHVFTNVEKKLYCAPQPQKLRNSKSKHSKLEIRNNSKPNHGVGKRNMLRLKKEN